MGITSKTWQNSVAIDEYKGPHWEEGKHILDLGNSEGVRIFYFLGVSSLSNRMGWASDSLFVMDFMIK